MDTHNEKRTKRNLIIFTLMVLGIAAFAGAIEPLTFASGA
jgi:hypothetical protein